jgi:hypothetical protein
MQRVVKRMLHVAVAASVSRWFDNAQKLHRQRGITVAEERQASKLVLVPLSRHLISLCLSPSLSLLV